MCGWTMGICSVGDETVARIQGDGESESSNAHSIELVLTKVLWEAVKIM